MFRNPVRGLPREVLVLSAVAFAVAIGFGILAPAIPVFAREFGVTRTAAAAVISAFAFMRFVSALGSGQLVDRFGERRVLATGIWIVAGSSGLAGLAQSYPQLLLLRGIGGVGSAMFTVAAMSLLLRVVDADRRGQATATWQAGFLLGGILGPGVGGALAVGSVRAPFFVYAATLAVAGAIGMLYLRRPSASEATSPPDGRAGPVPAPGIGLRVALTQRPYLAALTASLATGWSLFGVRVALMPLFVTELLGLTTVWTGLGFLISAAVQVVTLIPAARITDRVGRRPSLIAGTALGAASYLLVAVNESLAAFLGSMVIFGMAAAFLGVAPAAIVGDVVTRSTVDSGPAAVAEPRRIRGSRGSRRGGRGGRGGGGGGREGRGRGGKAVAVYQMASDFGVIVGPLIAGELAESYSFSAAFATTAVLIGAACGMAIWMPETRTVRQPEPVQTASRE